MKHSIRFTTTLFSFAVFVLISILGGCSSSNKETDLNFILISIDTLRADHLHCYGYPRKTSPNIDRIAAASMVFENAVSQSAWTLPSHVSMMTGLYPSEHGLLFYDNEGLEHKKTYGTMDRNLPTLAKILKKNGYATGSYNGGAWVDPAFGLDEGFDTYKWGGRYFKDNVPKAMKWIKAHKKRKFFFFLHAYDVHPPFNAGREFNPFYKYQGQKNLNKIDQTTVSNVDTPEYEYILSQYDAGIRRADFYLGKFFDFLREENLSQRTVLIITSDHGEMLLKRHGQWGHIYPLYEELIHVPLIVYVPGQNSVRIPGQVPASVSLLPTILKLADITAPGVRWNRSLMPLVKGERISFEYIISETGRIKGNRICRSLRSDPWKLLVFAEKDQDARFELFHLGNDPEEQINLSSRYPERVRQLFSILHARILSPRMNQNIKSIDKKTLESLKSLGYIK